MSTRTAKRPKIDAGTEPRALVYAEVATGPNGGLRVEAMVNEHNGPEIDVEAFGDGAHGSIHLGNDEMIDALIACLKSVRDRLPEAEAAFYAEHEVRMVG